VPKQLLNRPDIIVCLEEVACKTVAKRMCCRSLTDSGLANRLFDCLLYMRFMQMIPPVFSGLLHIGQLLRWEKPLPDKVPGRIFIFLPECVYQKYTVIVSIQITLVQIFQRLKVCLEFRENYFGNGNGSVFLSLAVMDS
jgi:hypothetical protein